MKPLFAIILAACIFPGCNTNDPAVTEIPDNNSIVPSCDSCYFQKSVLEPVSVAVNKGAAITEPTAIAFFHLLTAILQYDGRMPDSLPDKLKHDHRQTIYATIEQNGVYNHFMVPVLDSLKVKRINGNYLDSTITFMCKGKPYTIDVTGFKENDGVILFTPSKEPVLWKDQKGSKHCDYTYFTFCYFKK